MTEARIGAPSQDTDRAWIAPQSELRNVLLRPLPEVAWAFLTLSLPGPDSKTLFVPRSSCLIGQLPGPFLEAREE
eukprot:4213929-Prymnesium_polylepis.1